jgi:hypothetical protein
MLATAIILAIAISLACAFHATSGIATGRRFAIMGISMSIASLLGSACLAFIFAFGG